MNRSATCGVGLLWAAVLGADVLTVAMTGRAASLARAEGVEELDRARDVAATVEQMAQLRRSIPSWGTAHRPDGPLAPSISSVLASCGLAATTLASVTADAAAPASGEGDLRTIKRQRASATLSSLTLPQLGAFLAAWRQRQPAWAISGIDLAPESTAATPSRAGADLPLRATITMETLFVERVPEGGRQ